MASFQLEFKLMCGLELDKAADVYVGHCPGLGVCSQGTTRQEAKKAIASAVKLYLGQCLKRGLLSRMLAAKGFVVAQGVSAPRNQAMKFVETFHIVVPFDLVQRELCGGPDAFPN